jgi:alkylation response protein AidB-like acyl-CoA dehydrogenase
MTQFMPVAAMEAAVRSVLAGGAPQRPVALRSHPHLQGFPGLDLPTRTGGGGWSASDVAALFCRMGRIDAELRDLTGAGHARLLSLVQTRVFDAFLGAIARGESYCAVAITEPEVGSDLHAIGTTATPAADGYVLDGIKQHISRVAECDHFIVFAAVRRPDRTAITAFLVPRDAEGLRVETMSPMGMATVTWGRVILRGVRVPRENRVGREGQALSLFLRHFSYWRTMTAAVAIGSAQAALDQTATWMKTRHAFGGPIGRFSHLQQALAQHVARLRMAWLLVEDVAAQLDARRWPVFDAAMAKAEAVEAALAATDWCMTTFGATGYNVETGLEKRYRDLAGLRIADGTTDVLRGQVARAFLGERLYELSLNRIPETDHEHDRPLRRFW